MSGSLNICKIPDDLTSKLRKFRFQKSDSSTALIRKRIKIVKESQEIELDDQLEDCSIDEIRSLLPDRQPRFVILSYKYQHSDGRLSFPLCMIFSSPLGCNPELQMMYAGSKNNLAKESGVGKEFELRDLDDLTEDYILERLESTTASVVLMSHRPNLPYPCKICSYSFAMQKALQFHSLANHPDLYINWLVAEKRKLKRDESKLNECGDRAKGDDLLVYDVDERSATKWPDQNGNCKSAENLKEFGFGQDLVELDENRFEESSTSNFHQGSQECRSGSSEKENSKEKGVCDVDLKSLASFSSFGKPINEDQSTKPQSTLFSRENGNELRRIRSRSPDDRRNRNRRKSPVEFSRFNGAWRNNANQKRRRSPDADERSRSRRRERTSSRSRSFERQPRSPTTSRSRREVLDERRRRFGVGLNVHPNSYSYEPYRSTSLKRNKNRFTWRRPQSKTPVKRPSAQMINESRRMRRRVKEPYCLQNHGLKHVRDDLFIYFHSGHDDLLKNLSTKTSKLYRQAAFNIDESYKLDEDPRFLSHHCLCVDGRNIQLNNLSPETDIWREDAVSEVLSRRAKIYDYKIERMQQVNVSHYSQNVMHLYCSSSLAGEIGRTKQDLFQTTDHSNCKRKRLNLNDRNVRSLLDCVDNRS